MRARSLLQLFAAVILLGLLHVRAETLGEIPFQYRDGFLWLEVYADGERQPLNFLFDSGASSSVLSIHAARRLNMKLGSPQRVLGVHSQTIGYRIRGFKSRAAGKALPESLLAIDLSAVSSTVHQPIDGLIGADFFRGRVVQIDFAARKVRVLEHARPSGRSAVLPIKWCNEAICVPVGLAGTSPQWMRLDTGCESALEWAPGRPLAHRDSVVRSVSIGLASASIRYIHADIQLGAHGLQGVLIGVHKQRIFPGESGLLGNKVLSRFRVTIDSPRRRVILDKS